MYAIAFDLDGDKLERNYPGPSTNNAYPAIRDILVRLGFEWKQRSVYWGNDSVDAIQCVIAVQTLALELPWFANSVRDIQMLRIELHHDLMPAIRFIVDN